MSRFGSVLLGLLLTGSCCPPKKSATTTPTPVEPVVDVAPPPVKDPALVAYEAAQAEVVRLRALADQDPLLAKWTGPYDGVPPWDKAKPALVGPAFTLGLQLLMAEIDVIVKNPAPATFQTVFVPLQDAGRHEDRAETIFSVLTSSLNGPEVQAVDQEWSPKLAEAYDRITFNSGLFAKISAVYEARMSAGLTPQEQRLVELTYARYVQSGAKLDAQGKAQLGAINQQLAGLFTEFSQKVLKDEETWIVLETQKDLAGLSPGLIASMKAAADERKLAGKWVVVNTRSSVDPFLTSSSRRDLREKVWKAFKGRGDNGGATDTNAIISKIVALRTERAQLLGYATHAHWRMYDSMAKDPAKAQDLMMRVWPAATARVKQEVSDMAAIAKKDKVKAIEGWDYLYYAEKVRKKKYDLDQEQLKPYFELNNMIAASMYMAEQLYGLTFKEITGTVPVFHPDVRVWEVNGKDGKYVGLFYGDYFARGGKRSGAWASGYRGHETFTGKEVTAITSNNNNFVKGAPGEPVLISLDDAQTLFHEFGHGLHGLLSEVNFPGLSNTPRDFVEYPSQVHEMWVLTRPILDKYGLHYQTKAKMPQKLLDKVEASKQFNQGYATVEYLSSALVDMALHTLPAGTTVDADAFERDTLTKLGMPKEIAMRHRLPQFLHLFSSDSYSAGYYSYLWSEVMDADTRQAFKEAGNVFDPTVAGKMKQFILAPGNTTDRAEAYRQFRGRDPEVKALLEKRGFPTTN